MKPMLAACLGMLISTHSIAFDMPDGMVDIRDPNFKGEVIEIITPSTVKVEVDRNNRAEHILLEFVNVDFAGDADVECDGHYRRRWSHTRNGIAGKHPYYKVTTKLGNKVYRACERLREDLLGEEVKIEVSSWTQPTLKGYLFIDETNYNHSLIQRGIYRVDYTQTRSATMALMEGRARCKRVGLWSSLKGNTIENMKCQETFLQ